MARRLFARLWVCMVTCVNNTPSTTAHFQRSRTPGHAVTDSLYKGPGRVHSTEGVLGLFFEFLDTFSVKSQHECVVRLCTVPLPVLGRS